MEDFKKMLGFSLFSFPFFYVSNMHNEQSILYGIGTLSIWISTYYFLKYLFIQFVDIVIRFGKKNEE